MSRIRFSRFQVKLWGGAAAALLLLMAGGCASKPTARKLIFYPPAPDEPRFQYLLGFSSEKEFFGEKGFRKFVLGHGDIAKNVGKPYGITTRTNQILIPDTGFSGVGIVDLKKGVLQQFIPQSEGRMQSPINAATDAEGNLYVTDTERDQVLIYGPDQSPLEPMGRKDEMKPCGIAIAGQSLYLTDLKNHQVRIYSLPDRKLVRTLPREDEEGKGKLYSPVSVAVGPKGEVYVADPGAFCVQAYDAEGKFLRTIGRQGVGPGMFARPRGLAVDREGRLYVVDAASQRIQLFDSEGHLLIYLGDPTITGAGSTHLPAGIAVDYDNVAYFQKFAAPGKQLEYVVYLTNQYGEPKVSVYGFLKKR
jgi:DNA-binding beta-propeller fold protein YncE